MTLNTKPVGYGFRCSYDNWRFLVTDSGVHIFEVAASSRDSEQSFPPQSVTSG